MSTFAPLHVSSKSASTHNRACKSICTKNSWQWEIPSSDQGHNIPIPIALQVEAIYNKLKHLFKNLLLLRPACHVHWAIQGMKQLSLAQGSMPIRGFLCAWTNPFWPWYSSYRATHVRSPRRHWQSSKWTRVGLTSLIVAAIQKRKSQHPRHSVPIPGANSIMILHSAAFVWEAIVFHHDTGYWVGFPILGAKLWIGPNKQAQLNALPPFQHRFWRQHDCWFYHLGNFHHNLITLMRFKPTPHMSNLFISPSATALPAEDGIDSTQGTLEDTCATYQSPLVAPDIGVSGIVIATTNIVDGLEHDLLSTNELTNACPANDHMPLEDLPDSTEIIVNPPFASWGSSSFGDSGFGTPCSSPTRRVSDAHWQGGEWDGDLHGWGIGCITISLLKFCAIEPKLGRVIFVISWGCLFYHLHT